MAPPSPPPPPGWGWGAGSLAPSTSLSVFSLLSLSVSPSLSPCPDWLLVPLLPFSLCRSSPPLPSPLSITLSAAVSLSLLYLGSFPSTPCLCSFPPISFSPGVGLFLSCRRPTRWKGSFPESSPRDPRLGPLHPSPPSPSEEPPVSPGSLIPR